MKLISPQSQLRDLVETYVRKQRRISPAERDHVWMGAVKKDRPFSRDVLLILCIIGIAQVTSRGGPPRYCKSSHCFNS